MDTSTPLLTDLCQLSACTDEPDGRPTDTALLDLGRDLGAAIGSHRGFRLTITHQGYPVVLTVTTPGGPGGDDVRTSLRLPLRRIAGRFEIGSQIVFYAGTPGALVDLAADLQHVLRTGRPEERSIRIVLDEDLPAGTLRPGLRGVAELAVINRAAGLLLERGDDGADVDAAVRRRAEAAGLDPYTWAAELVRAVRR